jgi:hypothetical protein
VAKSTFPKQIMLHVIWAFDGKPFASEADCTTAIREHHDDICKRIKRDVAWDPQELVLKSTCVKIRHERWDDDNEEGEAETVIELSTPNPAGFTAGELMFKMHNAVVEYLRDMDHKFYEGLVLDEDATGEVPLYEIMLGS